jgi:hypothetical protein
MTKRQRHQVRRPLSERVEDALPGALVALLVTALLTASCVVWTANYRECRAHGFSAFYCATAR